MNVLSLFDGMSCGRQALKELEIPVTNYWSSEIDKWAIQIAQKNHPDNIPLGDINDWRSWDIPWHKVDLVFAGFPCQAWSVAGKQKGKEDKRGSLAWVMMDIFNHIKKLNPEVKFLFENVRMKKDFLKEVNELIGVEPILINSALVSAQNRNRYYWHNLGVVEQPEDREIYLKDIIQPKTEISDKFYYSKKSIAYMERGNTKWQQEGKRRADRYEQNINTEKSFCLTANWCKGVPYNYFNDERQIPLNYSSSGGGKAGNTGGLYLDNLKIRKLTPIECERLQTLPDNYTEGVSNSQRYKMLGNGWTVEVIKHILKNLT